MDLALARGASERVRGAFPPWRQVNVLLEETATDPKQYNLLSRPPLVAIFNWGTGPIRGILQKPGLFGGAYFVVSGAELRMNGVLLGTVNGSGPCVMAGGNAELVVTCGQTAYSYNGTDLAAIAFPDGADVRSVRWLGARFYFVRKGSGRFYWSDLNDGRTIGGFNFATAESEQDELYDIRLQGDVAWMLGAGSGEAWVSTGDNDLPLTRVVQRTLDRGVKDTGCAEEIEGTVYFIASDGMICRILNAAERVSDGSMDEKIRQSGTASAFYFQYEGKPVFCVRLDGGTFGLDLALDHQPIEFVTNGRGHWAPLCAVMDGPEPRFGDDAAGTVWGFDNASVTDSGQAVFPRIFSAGLPLPSQPQSIANVVVQGNSGDTQALTGDAANPILEMRCSRDGGRTFNPWRAKEWGRAGEYKRKARFGACGMYGPPGFLAEFRMLACVPLRVASVKANEPLSGRGR